MSKARFDAALFDPPRQSFVPGSDFAQFQTGIHIVHGLGSEQDFFRTCSKALDRRPKFRIEHWSHLS